MTWNPTRRKLAIATWRAPREPNIYGTLTLDAGEVLRYLEQARESTGERVTLTAFVGKAVAAALAAEPSLNGRIRFGRYIPHETVDVAFLVAFDDGGDLARVKVEHVDEKSTVEIARELARGAGRLRHGQDEQFEKSRRALRILPSWAIRPLVWLTGWLTGSLGVDATALGLERFPFGSCVVTSVGMFGIDQGFVPPTPFARVPLYVLIGAVRDGVAVEDGEVVVRPQVTLSATIDHRYVDGYQIAVLADHVRRAFDDPWRLDGGPMGAAERQPGAQQQRAGGDGMEIETKAGA